MLRFLSTQRRAVFRVAKRLAGSKASCPPSSCNTCQASAATSNGKALYHSIQPFKGEFKTPKISTADQYVHSLKGRNLKVFYFGELLKEPSEHPVIKPSVNAVAETYRLAEDHPELALVKSNLSGVQCNRFLHVTESAQDVVNQSLMQRMLGQRTGTCFQRCVGMDAINSNYSVTFEIDQKYKTNYHERFVHFVKKMQHEGCVIGGAMTDPKGDRGRGPAEQIDQDMYLRVVERRPDGVVIRGAKAHQTGCINSHWLIVMPGTRLSDKEKQFAITCALPVDTKGISYIYGRQSCDTRHMEDSTIDQGNHKFAGQEALIVFEDVFVPNELIFMNGETEFATELVERFTAYHRRSYICKAGLGDVLVGAAALVADYNGAAKASHIKDKLVEMVHLNETIAATALAASHRSTQTKAGNFQPDVMFANVCKQNVTRFPYEMGRLAQDLAGGLVVTLPADADFKHPEAGPILKKYLKGRDDVDVDDRRKVLRLIENMTMGRNAVGYLTESLHGAGSPQAQRILIARQANIEQKKVLAKKLADIKTQPSGRL